MKYVEHVQIVGCCTMNSILQLVNSFCIFIFKCFHCTTPSTTSILHFKEFWELCYMHKMQNNCFVQLCANDGTVRPKTYRCWCVVLLLLYWIEVSAFICLNCSK
jgi:hypothetical protein